MYLALLHLPKRLLQGLVLETEEYAGGGRAGARRALVSEVTPTRCSE